MFKSNAVTSTNTEMVVCISAIVSPIPPTVVKLANESLVDESILKSI